MPLVKVDLCPFDIEQEVVGDETRIRFWSHNRDSEMCLVRVEDYKLPYWLQFPERYLKKELVEKTDDDGEIFYEDKYTEIPGDEGKVDWENIDNVNAFGQALPSYLKAKNKWSFDTPVEKRRTYYDFLRGKKVVAKLRFNTSYAASEVKRNIKNSPMKCPWDPMKYFQPLLHEVISKINAIRRLTAEKNLGYVDWFTAQGEEVSPTDPMRISKAKHEYVVSWKDLEPIPEELTKDWVIHPKLMAYDIECSSDSHLIFPNEFRASNEAFMISSAVREIGRPETQKVYCIILGDVRKASIRDPNAIIIRVRSEYELVKAWCDLLESEDVDIITGHNILAFDNNYLNQRLRRLGLKWFPSASRLLDDEIDFIDESWSSSNASSVTIKFPKFSGRIFVDTYRMAVMNMALRLENYKLETVAKHYLGKGKVDVTPAELLKGYARYRKALETLERVSSKGSPVTPHKNVSEKVWQIVTREYLEAMFEMERLTNYCITDSTLCIELFEVTAAWIDIEEISRVMNICRRHAYTKGQSFRIMSSMYKMFYDAKIILDESWEAPMAAKFFGALNMGSYLGLYGLTIEAIYVDINSMYPSIIQAYNVCGSTVVPPDLREEYIKEDKVFYDTWIEKNGEPMVACFVKKEVHEGFLPQRVRILLEARDKVREPLKTGKWPDGTPLTARDKIIIDKKQNALKVAANSHYGTLKGNAENNEGNISTPSGACFVTKKGRDTILSVKECLETGPARLINVDEQGNPKGVKVFYGDTDSLMFTPLGVTDTRITRILSVAYVEAINRHIAPLAVKVEGIFDMLLLIAKMYLMRSLVVKVPKEREDDINEWAKSLIAHCWGEGERPPFPSLEGLTFTAGKLKYTGVPPVKRDKPLVMKELYQTIGNLALDRELLEKPFERAQRITDEVFLAVHRMKAKKVPREKYGISTRFAKECKSAVSVFANEMALKGQPIQKGEWFYYVLVKVPGAKKNLAKGYRMRRLENVNPLEPIDIHEYLRLLAEPIDFLLSRIYMEIEPYEEFLHKKGALEKIQMIVGADDLGYEVYASQLQTLVNAAIEKKRKNLAKKGNIDKVVPDLTVPRTSLRDLVKWREELETDSKRVVTGCVKDLRGTGSVLTVPSASLIHNIMVAEELGHLDVYTKALVSEEAYETIRGYYA